MEKKLFSAVKDFQEDLRDEGHELITVNQNSDKLYNLTVVDYARVIGASIDREKNENIHFKNSVFQNNIEKLREPWLKVFLADS